MSHKWEFEDEYFQLERDLQQAQAEEDGLRCTQIQARLQELDDMRWSAKTARFTELAPYRSVVEALEQTAVRLGLPFPNLADPHHRSDDGRFIFAVSDGVRTVQVWPMESRGYYDIDLFDYPADQAQGLCYHGTTTRFDEATIVLSRWFVERCPIEALQTQFVWLARQPQRVPNPRKSVRPDSG